MTESEAKERAKAVFHDWRERALSDPGNHRYYISHISLMEDAIAAALLDVQRETAKRCAEIAAKDSASCCSLRVASAIRREFGVKP